MYSVANSIFPMRRKAGKESPGMIDQSCLANDLRFASFLYHAGNSGLLLADFVLSRSSHP